MTCSLVPEKSEFKYSEVVFLGGSVLQTCSSDQDVYDLQTYSTHQYSPVPVSRSQTPRNASLSETFTGSPTRVRTTSNMDLSSCSYFYSNVSTSQTLQNVPTLNLSPSYCRTVSISDIKVQLGGEKEPPGEMSESSPAFSLHHQIPLSFSDFSIISPSTILLSHPRLTSTPSTQHPASL